MEKILAILILFTVFTNCVSEASGRAAREKKRYGKGITGVAADLAVSKDFLTTALPNIIGEKVIFSPDDEKVVWWCMRRCSLPNTVAKWYAPDGTLYKEEKIHNFVNINWSKAELQIKGTDAASKEGKWRVAIYRRKQLYDQVWFYIGTPKEKPPVMGEDLL